MNAAAKRVGWIAGGAVGLAALVGIGSVATPWLRYGHARKSDGPPVLLDHYMPEFEIVERHETRVAAPADLAFAAAREMDLLSSPAVHAIVRGRELLLRAGPGTERVAQPFVDEMISIGWGVLAEAPHREIVLGAVTRPWEADVRFQSLPPDEFAAFASPGYVKIAWNLAVESTGPTTSVFRSETRVATTDASARKRFRRYWTIFSPGIRLIRYESLRLVKAEAKRRFAAERRASISGGVVQHP
jgi:hypothetical protein